MTETVNLIQECEAPFPRLGEVYRVLALALDTKNRDRDLDAFARDEKYDWRMPRKIRHNLFGLSLRSLFRSDFGKGFLEILNGSLIDFEKNYGGMVCDFSADYLSRKDVESVLLKGYFPVFVGASLSALLSNGKVVKSADFFRIIESSFPFYEVFEVFSRHCGEGLVKVVYPDSTGEVKRKKENLDRWAKGSVLPDLTSIKGFVSDVRDFMGRQEVCQLSEEEIDELAAWMVVARGLGFSGDSKFRMSLKTFSSLMNKDFTSDIRWANEIAAEKSLLRLRVNAMLNDELSGVRSKKPGSQDVSLKKLENIVSDLDIKYPDGRLNHYKHWLRARWHVLSGRPATALPDYQKSLKSAWYRAGKLQAEILKEAMMVAAYAHLFRKDLGDAGKTSDGKLSPKSFLKALKNKAVHFKVFPKPDESLFRPEYESPKFKEFLEWEWGAEEVEDWETEEWARCFCQKFHPKNWFEEAGVKKHAPVLDPMLWVNWGEIDKVKPNLDKLRYQVKVPFRDATHRKLPQICFFTTFGHSRDIEVLLERDPSLVNVLDVQGASPVLRAIQSVQDSVSNSIDHEQERKKLDLILKCPHEPKVLDSMTARKRLSVLHLAVEYGDPGVVRRLLDLGANPVLVHGVDGRQPLGTCVSIVGNILHPERMFPELLKGFLIDSQSQAEFLRRYAAFAYSPEGQVPFGFLQTRECKHLLKSILDSMLFGLKGKVKRHKDMLEIAEVLLKSGNDPNHPAIAPIRGYTPLMVAAEWDDVDLFELLVSYGGEPELECLIPGPHGLPVLLDCMGIAQWWGSKKVIRYLEAKRYRWMA